MRAITVRQPWAFALVHLGKNPENRTRNLAGDYRGPVAIHAGLTRDPSAWQHPAFRDAWYLHLTEACGYELDQLPEFGLLQERSVNGLEVGAIIGVGQLVDVHPCADACCLPWGEHEYVEIRTLCQEEPDVVSARMHLVFEDVIPLTQPIPAKGALGLWTPDAELLAQIHDQLQEAS